MRLSNAGNAKGSRLKFWVRLTVLALSFALVFGFAVTGDIFAGETDNIALADDVGGGLNSFRVDHEINAQTMNFPGSASATTWSQNLTTANTVFSDSNVSAFMETGAGTTLITTGGTGNFSIAEDKDHEVRAPSIYATLNYYSSSQLFWSLLNRTDGSGNRVYKVEVSYSVEMQRPNEGGAGTDQMGMLAGASATALSGKDVSGWKFPEYGKNDWKTYTGSVELTKAIPYLVLAFYAQTGNWNKTRMNVRNVNLTVKFTQVSAAPSDGAASYFDDGAAPKLVGYDVANASDPVNAKTYPYRPDNTNDNTPWDVYPVSGNATTDSMLGQLTAGADYVAAGQDASLRSYTNKVLGEKGGKAYYKRLSLSYADYYNFDVFGLPTDGTRRPDVLGNSVNANFSSGLKYIQIGDQGSSVGATDGAWFTTYEASTGKTIYSGGTAVGWAEISKTDRTNYNINLYFYTNVYSLDITVEDFGERSGASSVEVSGIDTKNAELPTLSGTNNAVSAGNPANWADVKWYNSSVLNLRMNGYNEDDVDGGFTPYLWYYSVQRSDTPVSFSPLKYTKQQLLAAAPFSVASLDFSFDFDKGWAVFGVGDSGEDTGVYNLADAANNGADFSGPGYYIFTFYAMDMTGNVETDPDGNAVSISFCVKADYRTPVYTVEMNFGGGNTITAAENGKWANDELTLNLVTESAAPLSGAILEFTDKRGGEHKLFVRDGRIIGFDAYDYSAAPVSELPAEVTSGLGIKVRYAIDSLQRGVFTFIYGYAIAGSDGSISFAESIGPDGFINTSATFALHVGADETNRSNDVRYSDTQWMNGKYPGVIIRVDRSSPSTPTLTAQGKYLAEGNNRQSANVAKADRNWYTAGWTLDTMLEFSDNLSGQFGKDIKIYIGMKVVSDDSGFTDKGGRALSIADFETAFAGIEANAFDFAAGVAWDALYTVGSDSFELYTNYLLDMLAAKDAGMRALYIWSVDQAGNKSDLSVKYILNDANVYYAESAVVNPFGDGSDNRLIQSDTSATPSSYFRRGETVAFRLALADGYVPYKLVKANVPDPQMELVLLNSGDGVYLDNDMINSYYGEYASVHSSNTVYVSVDRTDTLGTLYNANAVLHFDLHIRKAVSLTLTDSVVRYMGAPTVVPMTLSVPEAYPDVAYLFTGRNDTVFNNGAEPEWGVVPKDLGEYNLEFKLDTEQYISNVVRSNYTIGKANVSVIASAGTGNYGDEISLAYTLDGLVGEDLTAYQTDGLLPAGTVEGVLKLAGYEPSAYNRLNVGSYRIELASAFEFANYNVNFVTGAYQVLPRPINAIVSAGQQKTYGDADPDFTFEVVKTEIDAYGFAWNDVFLNARLISSDGDKYVLQGTEGNISRVAGENANESYPYSTDSARFRVGANFYIVLNSSDGFKINQRLVEIRPVPNQSAQFNADGNYNVLYAFVDPADSAFASQISGNLYLGAVSEDLLSDPKFELYSYQIENVKNGIPGVTASDTNIRVEFQNPDNIVFVVKKVKEGANVVYAVFNAGSPITGVFGTPISPDALKFDASRFTVSGLPEGYTVEWTAGVPDNPDGRGNVGVYGVTVTGAVVKNAAGEPDAAYSVEVAGFSVTYLPFNLTIRPVIGTHAKYYGEPDNVYGLDYEIFGALPFEGYVVDKSGITGSFARGKYADGGLSAVLGTQFDRVSDAQGNFSVGGSAYYYGLTVGKPFVSNDANIRIVADEEYMRSQRLVINRKKIILTAGDFIAKGKSYDGSTAVIYTSEAEKRAAINLASKLARTTDDVYADFSAFYSSPEPGIVNVEFGRLELKGADAGNYALYLTEIAEYDKDYDVYTVNQLPDGTSITISKQTITLTKSDFILTKQYDGTRIMTADNIIFSEFSPLYGLQKILPGTSSRFPVKDVNSNFSVDIELIIVGIKLDPDHLTYESTDADITVSVESGTYTGIKIQIRNLSGSITERVITLDSFSELKAVDRPYDGTNKVEIAYNFVKGAIVEGENIVVSFDATAESKNHSGASADGKWAVAFGQPSVNDTNYKLGFTSEDLNARYGGADGIRIEISKAELQLNLSFDPAREYGGRTEEHSKLVKGSDVNGRGTTAGEEYAFKTATPVQTFAEEIAKLGYNWDSVEFYYSNEGAFNGNVMFNADGTVASHNVLISGLVLTETGDNGYLDNYVLGGYVWVAPDASSAGGYRSIAQTVKAGSGNYELVSGRAIDSFELLGAATLKPKTVRPILSGITISGKYYDGTDKAEATLSDIHNLGIADEDRDTVSMTFDARFENVNVGFQRVNVTITSMGASTPAFEYIARNYVLVKEVSAYQDGIEIKAAPVTAKLSLGNKIYDGNNYVTGQISGEINGLYDLDAGFYNISYLTGGFTDKNVARNERGEVVDKAGFVYGVSLMSNRVAVNYHLVYPSGELKEGALEAAAYGRLPKTDAQGNPIYYYPMTSSVYNSVLSNLYNSTEHGAVIAKYNESGRVYYLVQNKVSGTVRSDTTDISLALAEASGRILPKRASMNVSPVEGKAGVFEKFYDGTSIFAGKLGVDYIITSGDGVTIEEASARFEKAEAGTVGILFTVTKASGAESGNYSFEPFIGIQGKITKRSIEATLKDGSVQYGSADKNFEVEYSMTGPENSKYPIFAAEGDIFMNFENYRALFADAFALLSAVELPYAVYKDAAGAEVMGSWELIENKHLYTSQTGALPLYKNGDVYAAMTQVEQDAQYATYTEAYKLEGGVYLKLTEAEFKANYEAADANKFIVYSRSAGIIALTPDEINSVCSATADSIIGSLGLYKNVDGVYSLISSAELTEYLAPAPAPAPVRAVFALNGKIEIYKLLEEEVSLPKISSAVNAATEVGEYQYKLLGGTSGNYAFKVEYTGEGFSKLSVVKRELFVYAEDTVKNGAGYFYVKDYGSDAPAIKLGYSDSATGAGSGLKNGQSDAVFKVKPTAEFRLWNGTAWSDVPLTAKDIISSDLQPGQFYGVYIDLSQAAADNYRFTLKYTSAADFAKLLVKLPEIKGLSFTAATVSYNGKSAADAIRIAGAQNGDVDAYTYYKKADDGTWDQTPISRDDVVNAGEYKIVATLSRAIDARYSATWSAEAILTISPATFSMEIPIMSFNYDYEDHRLSANQLVYNGVDKSLVLNYVNLSYERDGSPVYGSITEAGTYSVTATFSPVSAQGAAANYNGYVAKGTLVINPVVIEIYVDETSKMQLFEENTANYSIQYTAQISDTFAELGFTADDIPQLRVTYVKSGLTSKKTVINEAGTYFYEVSLEDENTNFKLTGATGTVVVGHRNFELVNDDYVYVSANFVGNVITGNALSFSYGEIYSEDGQGNVNAYWNVVDQYMGSLSDKYHAASLGGILEIKLMNGASAVQPSAQMELTVALPYTISSLDGYQVYYVNKEGGLSLLEGYSSADGYITYITDYISNLIFVKITDINMLLGLPYWVWGIIGGAALIVIAALVTVIVLAAKKKKKVRPALAAAAAESGSAEPAQTSVEGLFSPYYTEPETVITATPDPTPPATPESVPEPPKATPQVKKKKPEVRKKETPAPQAQEANQSADAGAARELNSAPAAENASSAISSANSAPSVSTEEARPKAVPRPAAGPRPTAAPRPASARPAATPRPASARPVSNSGAPATGNAPARPAVVPPRPDRPPASKRPPQD